jgi:hypothetical protein
MRFIEVLFDHNASVLVEARPFLVVELTEHDEDVSYLVDQGTRFGSMKQLQQHLTKVTGDEVDLREMALSCEP